MNTVIQTLITAGVLAHDTVVTAKISSQSKYGMITFQYRDMVIDKINDTCDMLLLRDPYSSMAISLSIDNITGIEGMTLDRYAEVYNINADGSNKNTGRKRGRKPKSVGL
jgi:hypothetical protein